MQQLMVGPSAVARLLRVEEREVLADDVLGRVALDALRADVPCRDTAVDVQHEDRIFADAFHQQAEAFFALSQRLFVAASLGEVARHLRVADQRARRVAHCGDDDVGPEQPSLRTRQPSSSNDPVRWVISSSCSGSRRANASGG